MLGKFDFLTGATIIALATPKEAYDIGFEMGKGAWDLQEVQPQLAEWFRNRRGLEVAGLSEEEIRAFQENRNRPGRIVQVQHNPPGYRQVVDWDNYNNLPRAVAPRVQEESGTAMRLRLQQAQEQLARLWEDNLRENVNRHQIFDDLNGLYRETN